MAFLQQVCFTLAPRGHFKISGKQQIDLIKPPEPSAFLFGILFVLPGRVFIYGFPVGVAVIECITVNILKRQFCI